VRTFAVLPVVLFLGAFLRVDASPVRLLLMDFYGNGIKLNREHIRCDVDGALNAPFTVDQSQIVLDVPGGKNVNIAVRVLGFRKKDIQITCSKRESSCRAAMFLDLAPIGNLVPSGKSKVIRFPQRWFSKGHLYATVIFIGSGRRYDKWIEEGDPFEIPLEESGVASITGILQDGSVVSLIHSFNAYEAQIELRESR
jgi:hypothetical protein